MYKTLRIISTVLSAICVLAVVPLGIYVGVQYGILSGLGALLFFVLTALFKRMQEKKETPPAEPQGDFFHPIKKSDDKDRTDGDDAA